MYQYLFVLGIAIFSATITQAQQFDFRSEEQNFASLSPVVTDYRAPLVYKELKYHSGRSSSNTLLKSMKREGALLREGGSIVGYTSDGDVQFIGHYRGDRLKGEWKSYYGPGQLCDSGGIKNNVPDGEWKSWYENGQLRFIRTFHAFKFEKARQDISRRASKVISSPIVTIAREDLRVAYSYMSAAYSFHTLAKKSNARKLSGADWTSLRQRVDNNTFDGAEEYLPPFLECFHHGLYMNFYPDGGVKDSGYYKNGLREGVWEERVNNGNIVAKGFYYRGHKSDSWKYYDKNGELKYLENYNRIGRLVYRKEF